MTNKVFIDKDINILTGQKAQQELNKTSDEAYFREGRGVIQVSRERWRIAQHYERKTWMDIGLASTDDRNMYHMKVFKDYETIKGIDFKHAIELGCGPFTNLRLISNVCRVRNCSLLDPLIDQYLGHPNCYYDKKYLYKDPRYSMGFLDKYYWGKVASRFIPKRVFGKVPVHQLLSIPIEEMPTDTKYDLIVIVNVLEHCYDLEVIFDRLISIASPSAYLVYVDKYYSMERVKHDIGEIYDAGHPLRIPSDLIDAFLDSYWTPLFSMVHNYSYFIENEKRQYDEKYFIGKLIP